MSRIANTDARSFASLLINGANAAEAKGESSFDISGAVEDKYAEAKAAAQAAVDAAAPDTEA
jgi:hypothetical protein